MKRLATVFFGTHQFASSILEGLIKIPFIDINLVLTRPDRPAGRGQKLLPSAVKQMAEIYRLPIEQPATLKNYELKIKDCELGVVAQYGLLIPRHILEAPKLGVLNVHTSLLPKYRGASPIQSALMNGESETGVTIMKMDEGLDTGPIILQKRLGIGADDTYEDISKKLVFPALAALAEAIPAYISGTLVPIPQDGSRATVCHELAREDGYIDWQMTSAQIYDRYRGLTPWPGIWTSWNGKRLKLLRIKPTDKTLAAGKVQINNNQMYIGCNQGSIEVLKIQLEGKEKMDVKTFLLGHQKIAGVILGTRLV